MRDRTASVPLCFEHWNTSPFSDIIERIDSYLQKLKSSAFPSARASDRNLNELTWKLDAFFPLTSHANDPHPFEESTHHRANPQRNRQVHERDDEHRVERRERPLEPWLYEQRTNERWGVLIEEQ